jgi:RimK family alpha-L-glutamate ligase
MDTMRLVIVAGRPNSTNQSLRTAAAALDLDALVLSPDQTARRLRRGDVVLGRLDVLPDLRGPETGLETLRRLDERGVVVLNRAGPLLTAHDKLTTAIRLAAAGLPHPRTAHVGAAPGSGLEFPVVVKPRFGSGGRDVALCDSPAELAHILRGLDRTAWFRRQGALVQELVHPVGYDLRIVVAAGEVVGAVKRVAALGEWRTNIALGGHRVAIDPPAQAREIAVRAAAALETDLVGVDLLPDGKGGWTVLELNGAVDFTAEYSLGDESVFERVVNVLARSVRGETESSDGRPGRFSPERMRAAARIAAPAAEGAR